MPSSKPMENYMPLLYIGGNAVGVPDPSIDRARMTQAEILAELQRDPVHGWRFSAAVDQGLTFAMRADNLPYHIEIFYRRRSSRNRRFARALAAEVRRRRSELA